MESCDPILYEKLIIVCCGFSAYYVAILLTFEHSLKLIEMFTADACQGQTMGHWCRSFTYKSNRGGEWN